MTPPLPFVLDTDIGTDVDDALALAYALRHPGLELRAVTTVSGDAQLRGRIAVALLRLAGRDDVEVAAGVGGGSPGAWWGHEGEGILGASDGLPLSERDGVTLLLEEQPVEVATIGMQTNVAAALARDPGRARRMPRLVVMGGVFAPVRLGDVTLPPAVDHNLNSDQDGAVAALNAGIPTLYVPVDVTIGTFLTGAQRDRLRAGDALCRALADLVDVWTPILRRLSGPLLPEDVVAILHDPLTLACMVERGFVETATMPVTVAVHDGCVRTFVDPVAGHEAEVVTRVEAEAFAAHWLEVVLGR